MFSRCELRNVYKLRDWSFVGCLVPGKSRPQDTTSKDRNSFMDGSLGQLPVASGVDIQVREDQVYIAPSSTMATTCCFWC
jgi:hypothetical protein